MAPLPVIEGIFRVTLEWRYGLVVRAANVLHFADFGASGDEADLFAALAANLNNDMQELTATSTSLAEIDIIPLDGSSSTTVHVLDGTYVGRGTGEGIIQAATIISFATGHRGPSGRGRCYWPFPAESEVNMGHTDDTDRATVQDGWNTFLADMQTSGWPLAVASYVHAEARFVTSATVKELTGTQRRRLDAIR